MTYKISVIMPLYNVGKYLPASMASLFAQTLSDIQVICVDDGSTDNTLDTINRYASTHDNLVVMTQQNSGAAVARNRALAAAEGEFIAFLDPDDWYPDENVLEDLYHAASTNGALVCGGSLVEFFDDGKTVAQLEKPRNKCEFHEDGWIDYSDYQYDYFYQRFIFDSAFLKEEHLDFPEYRRYQDPPFFVSAMAKAGKFYALSRPTYCYRMVEKHVSWNEEKLSHLALGLRDVLETSRSYGYPDLHRTEAVRIFDLYRTWFEEVLDSSDGQLFEALKALEASIDVDFANNHRKTVNCKRSLQCLTRRYELEHPARLEGPELQADAFEEPSASQPKVCQNRPRVMTIVAGEGNAALFEKTVESLDRQAYANHQIVVLSSEKRIEDLAKIEAVAQAASFEPRSSDGIAADLNRCLSNGAWDYVHVLHPGDLMEPNALERLVGESEGSSASLCLYGTEFFFTNWEAYSRFAKTSISETTESVIERQEGADALVKALCAQNVPLPCLHQFISRKATKNQPLFDDGAPLLSFCGFSMSAAFSNQGVLIDPSPLYKARIDDSRETLVLNPRSMKSVALEALLGLMLYSPPSHHQAPCDETSNQTYAASLIERLLAPAKTDNDPIGHPSETPLEQMVLQRIEELSCKIDAPNPEAAENKKLKNELSRIKKSKSYRLAKRFSKAYGSVKKVLSRK
ncbi:glycosyltransferase [Eggerthellaceae bacterium zg-893]|nr:glycosyltransferase [Eggerthellaceae bacterium zg-893]